MKDVLEEVVDEKYYLSNANLKWLAEHNERHEQKGTGFKFNPKNPETEYASCLRANASFAPTDNAVFIGEPSVKQICNLMPSATRENPNQGRLYDTEGLSPTLGAMQGGNRQPFVIDDTYANREARVYDEAAPTLRADRSGLKVAEPVIARCVGGIGEKKSNGGTQWYQQDRVYQGDIALAHPSQIPGGSYRYAVEETSNLRIRKLTPKECFRLMGFDDASFHKAEAVNSNTQLYKQAGNSIVVDVLEELFCKMFDCRGRLQV